MAVLRSYVNTAIVIWLNHKFLNKKVETIQIIAGKNGYKLKSYSEITQKTN